MPMGVALHIVAQEQVPGLDLSVDGKAIGELSEQTVDQLCDALKVTSLVSFTSEDPEEIADLMGEEVIDVDDVDEFPGEDWFSAADRSEEHTSELQSLMRTSYAVFCLKKTTTK